MKKVLQTVEIEVCVEYPVIETSEEAPRGQGWKYTFLFNNVHAVTMRRGRKKDRSEQQQRHDLLLHKSRYGPLAYYKTRLEDLSKTIEQYRRTLHVVVSFWPRMLCRVFMDSLVPKPAVDLVRGLCRTSQCCVTFIRTVDLIARLPARCCDIRSRQQFRYPS